MVPVEAPAEIREGLLCALIFTVVALPEVIVLGINAVHLAEP